MELLEYRQSTEAFKIVMKYRPAGILSDGQKDAINEAFGELQQKIKEITAPEVKRPSRRKQTEKED